MQDSDPTLPTPDDTAAVSLAGEAATPPAPPPPAPRSNAGGLQRLVLILLAVIVVLVASFVTLLVARANGAGTTTPTAQTILAAAEQAKLDSGAYTFNGTLGLSFSSSSAAATSFTFTGSGKFTTSPMAMDTQLQIAFLGNQNTIEVLTDANQVYVHAPILLQLFGGTADPQKWLAIPLPSATGTTTPTSIADFYKQIQQPKLIGAQTLDGQDTWHIQGTLAGHPASGATTTAGTTAQITPPQVDLWIAKSTSNPVRFQVQTQASTSAGATTGGTTTGLPSQAAINVTADFSALNTAITITPPPASDVTPFPIPTLCPAGATPTPTPTPGGTPCIALPTLPGGLPGLPTPTPGS